MFKLRCYQRDAVLSIYNYFKHHKEGNPIVAMPTGTGKSLVITGFIESILSRWPEQKIVIATHVKEIISQNFSKMIGIWPTAPAGIYSAGLKRKDLFRNVTFAGIGSIYRKPELFAGTNLLFVDECDLVSPVDETMYLSFINALKKYNPRLRVIGFTATPWRTKGGRLTDSEGIFTDTCYDATSIEAFNWFLDEGYLVPLIPKRTNTFLDAKGVKKVGDEFNQKQLQAAVDKYDLSLKALEELCEYVGDSRKSWLLFCAGIEHSIHVAEILNTNFGIKTGIVHSGSKDYPMTSQERDETISEFESHGLRAVANNSVLSVGYDNTKIDVIGHLKPMGSSRRWVQELGRGTRPDFATGFDLGTRRGRLDAIYASGKHNCVVMDYGRNTERLGPINDPIIPNSKRRNSNNNSNSSNRTFDAPVKLCPNCKIYGSINARECFHCGHIYPVIVDISTCAGTEELIRKEAPEQPVIETVNVKYVTYKKHNTKTTKTPSLKVTYHSGLSYFSEYVSIESPRAKQHCRTWWMVRTTTQLPATVDLALEQVNKLKVPKQLAVWTNKKYPEIVRHIF